MSGFDEGDFTYDEYDDMVRDVRNYTSNLDLSSPSAADREVQDPSVRGLLQTIRETTNRDAAANRNSSDPFEVRNQLVDLKVFETIHLFLSDRSPRFCVRQLHGFQKRPRHVRLCGLDAVCILHE